MMWIGCRTLHLSSLSLSAYALHMCHERAVYFISVNAPIDDQSELGT